MIKKGLSSLIIFWSVLFVAVYVFFPSSSEWKKISANPLNLINIQPDKFSGYYPYGGKQFDLFVLDSINETHEGDIKDFYLWMENAYESWRQKAVQDGTFPFTGAEKLNLGKMILWYDSYFSSLIDITLRTEEEMRFAASLHTIIKSIIPKFSLKRGFEFTSVKKYMERQCFLQSVIIAGLLQEMGIEAGIAMVYMNKNGEESNNGHAVVLLKLSNGRDILVDASEKEAFDMHKGLFIAGKNSYRYANPIYDIKDRTIISYRIGETVTITTSVKPLDVNFIRSQFDSYRGEWVSGSLHYKKKDRKNLELSIRYFQRSIKECPENPLPVYLIARSYEEMGDKEKARNYFNNAYTLYSDYGWIPQGLKYKGL